MYKMGNTEPISPTRLDEHCLVSAEKNKFRLTPVTFLYDECNPKKRTWDPL